MKQATFALLLILLCLPVMAGNLKGTILDRATREPLMGATVQVVGTTIGTAADMNGNYQLQLPSTGTYSLSVRYIGYHDLTLTGMKVGNESQVINVELDADTQTLDDVTIVAQVKKSTDLAMMTDQRRSLVVQSGVSAQQISKTQDKDASEVIKRVPGVSIIDEKFVMVRGLSQRYNNVWINGSAVPSSEADSRAFSFDIIPSSQLDNMVIVKSPAPEYPADFTGGFILVNTKDMPSENGFSIAIGGAANDQTHFHNFNYNAGSATDFLGFDNGLRTLNKGIHTPMNTYAGSHTAIDITGNSLNNNWTVKQMKPLADLKLNLSYNHRWDTESGQAIGMLAAVNYSNSYRTFTDMENSLFANYDTANDRRVYLRKSTDQQYNHDVRLGALFNITFQPRSTRHRYEWKNIFNQLGKNRYTDRRGFTVNDQEHNMEYYYSSRTTYNTQLTGKHTYDESKLDWSAGYAYADRNLPDRRVIRLNDRTESTMGLYRISREFTKLEEHIFSANANYRKEWNMGRFLVEQFTPALSAGVYSEYRQRDYNTREFQYSYDPSTTNLPYGFEFTEDIAGSLLVPQNYGADKLFLLDETNRKNGYAGTNLQAAGYVGLNLPFGAFNAYAGMRYEYTRLQLISNTRQYEKSPVSTFYTYSDLFPSINLSYKFGEQQQMRIAYGKSVNRPEFRELSPSVYYDFDLASDVIGNSALKSCYIQNLDLRYEWYPTAGEQISVALFYKDFKNPIEWTYTVTGGTDLVYSYLNANGASNYGIELDIRKNLDFIGLSGFSWSFNGALIKSNVRFEEGSREKNRPMQGQSPYLINTGLFYAHTPSKFNVAVLYNRIGKRIVGVGRSLGSIGAEQTKNVPNSYEMPRHSFDLSIGKQWGKWEVKATLRDLLAQKVTFQQIEQVEVNGMEKSVEQITKQFRPGRSLGISVNYQF